MADPKIKYDIEADVKGDASVQALEQNLRDLGQTLDGELAGQARAAADALQSLGAKQEAVTTFQRLTNESSALAVELAQAQHGVAQLGAQLSAASTSTQQYVDAELKAKAALESTSAQLAAARKGYVELQAANVGAARKSDEYKAAAAAARDSIQRLTSQVKLENAALKEAGAAAQTAQQAQNRLGAQYNASTQALYKVQGAQTAANAALDAARERLRGAGIDAANLGQAENRLAAAIAAARHQALQIVPAYAQVAQASQKAEHQQERTSEAFRKGMTSISEQLRNIQNIATVALGGGFAAGLLRDVADTADAFDNLRARIKLVTGEDAQFEAGLAGVQRVALATSSSLESTGTLFARIAQAGKEFNLTQESALGLTQAINQAVQLSGGSAQAADAAVTQLIQGLQSGVLRGQEFNSVMEQAPRLAQALANGLGVTTGELRKMANEGQLTTKVVIGAIKSQGAALQEEFGKLPATVGRAITNLQTQWQLFIGGLNDSSGATSYVADGINALAGNLDTLARVAGLAGAALTASLAVQGAAALRAYATEAALAAGATNILSASIAKIPKVINIALAVTGFEVGYQIGEMLVQNSALARKFGVVLVGYFQGVVSSLQLVKESAAAVFTNDTINAAFARFEERNARIRTTLQDMMRDAEQAPPKVAAAADQAGVAVQGMGAAGAAAGQQLAQAGAAGAAGMTQTGKAAQDAHGIFLALLAELNKPAPKAGAMAAIAQELEQAKAKGADLQVLLAKNLPEAIGKLSGAELTKFRQEFDATMRAAGASGKELELGLRLIGEQAARSLGVDVVAAGKQVGSAFAQSDENMRALILSLRQLKEAGVDTATVLGQALSKMIDGAKNEAELEKVRARVQALRGELSEKITDGLLDQAAKKAEELKDALDAATPGINSVREAMKALGITSDEELKRVAASAKDAYDTVSSSGKASARELQEAFKKAAQAAIDANNGVAPVWVQAAAAMRGFELEADKAGKTTLKLKSATDQAADAHKAAAGAAGQQTTALERLNAEQERAIAAQEKANDLATRNLKLEEAKRTAGVINPVDAVPSFESQEQADAWLAEWKKQYAKKNAGLVSGSSTRTFMWDTTMGEWNGEVSAMKLRNTMKGNGNASESSQTPLEAMRSGQRITIDLRLDGRSYGDVDTDANGAAALQSLMRELERAKRNTGR